MHDVHLSSLRFAANDLPPRLPQAFIQAHGVGTLQVLHQWERKSLIDALQDGSPRRATDYPILARRKTAQTVTITVTASPIPPPAAAESPTYDEPVDVVAAANIAPVT
jgi:hypothetical protein